MMRIFFLSMSVLLLGISAASAQRLEIDRSGLEPLPQQQVAPPPPVQSEPPQVQVLPGLDRGQRQPKRDQTGKPSQVQQLGAAPSSPQVGDITDEVIVPSPTKRIENQTAVFNGLDKITGRIITFDVAINETVQFGALRVTPRVCYTRSASENENITSFIEVDEITLNNDIRRIFTGWQFASSPGLHAIEHPIYDAWLINCKQSAPSIVSSGEKR